MTTISNSTENTSSYIKPQVDDAVYCYQVKLLYKQLPIAIFAAMAVAMTFTYVMWDHTQSTKLLSWLSMIFILILANLFCNHQFKSGCKDVGCFQKWERCFLFGSTASALLWGSTSLWLALDTPVSLQTLHLIIITGLSGGAIAVLSSRLRIFQVFILVLMLPFILRLVYLGSPTYLAVAGLSVIYIVAMLFVAKRLNTVISDSLYLRFEHSELLSSYKYADQINKKANEAMYGLMKKNKEEELKLEKSESFLRAILTTANDSIITTDKNGIILSVNHAIERDFGYTPEEMIGQSINMIMEEDMGPRHDKYIEQYFQSDRPTLVGRMLDVTGKRKDGNTFPLEITVSESRIENEIYFTGIIRDITERKAQEAAMGNIMLELAKAKKDLEQANSLLHHQNLELTELSEHDALTNLPNRRFLHNAFAQEWPRHRRNKKPIAAVMMDIDFFKKFNDRYGHQAGDECLQKIAETFITNISRPGDFITRYGGEEFIAILPETDEQGAYFIAEKMRQAVSELNLEHKDSPVDHVTISGGIACLIPDGVNQSEDLIKQADEALYNAKDQGRNRVCLFNNVAHQKSSNKPK
ncbi:MAG: diguanylate cyclase [Gammaproteobacteria bacterium]|nr:diguanylate cyclase [Gammaproteobacteria bacterium]